MKKSTANDLGADLDLSSLLEPSDRWSRLGVRPRNAYGQSVGVPREPGSRIDPESSGTPWHMMTRPFKVEGKADACRRRPPCSGACNRRRQRPPVSGPAGQLRQAAAQRAGRLYEGDFDLGLAAFCRGAGVDPRNITSEARSMARCSSRDSCCARPCSGSWT